VTSAFTKRNPAAPQGFFACEAAGLAWLGAVDGGVACARVLHYDHTSLTLRRIDSVPPTRESAREFGVRLAATHDAGAAAFGAAPNGYRGPGFFGPLTQPLAMSFSAHGSWGEFYAAERLTPMAEIAAPRLSADGRAAISQVVKHCAAGHFDTDDGLARLHGDLWSGNVMWTVDGAVLIDPAAHGGHRETDLAMLAFFGFPHLADALDGYQSVRRLSQGWQRRVGLHQLYPLLAHVVLFGGGYPQHAEAVAASALTR
jgi:fructosamine-3-kinase